MSLPGQRPWLRKRFWAVVVVVIVLGFGVAAWALSENPYAGGNAITNLVNGFRPLRPTNLLLIGNSALKPSTATSITSGGSQAGIMIVAHIDPQQHQVVLISIPCDLLFATPGYRNPIPKIKTLFSLGARETPNQAVQLTVQAVERFTGLKITYWVVTDYQGLIDAVNAVGGVYVDITIRIDEPQNGHLNLYPGWQLLNGTEALAFVRAGQNQAPSSGSNDFMGDNYQTQVLTALYEKLLDKKSDLSHLSALINTWETDIVTNMSPSVLIRVAATVHRSQVPTINLAAVADSLLVGSGPAPGFNQENRITGASYDIVNPTQVYAALKPYGSTGVWTGWTLPQPSTIPVRVDASALWVAVLKTAGYPLIVTGSGTGRVVSVYYPPGKMAWGLAVARTLGTGDAHVEQGADSSAVVVTMP